MNIACPKCGEEISLNDCFKDKAAENELKTATIKCTNQDCPWEGPSQSYKVLLITNKDDCTIYTALIYMHRYIERNAS